MRVEKKKSPSLGLLGLAFLFLIVPSVNVFDILPDFIAYFIIAKRLDYPSDRAPFFAEAREAFRKLGIATLIKLPASMLMVSFRSKNVGDNDIRALFAITFAVIEATLLIIAVNNLFTALSYLGQRSDNSALISDFRVSKNKSVSVDSLKLLTYVFVIVRILFCFAPELLLLTRMVSESEYLRTFNVARLYPYTVVLGIAVTLWLGIFWSKRFKKYLRAIAREGGLRIAVDSMIDDQRRLELESEERVKGMHSALTLLAIGSVLTLELRFDNLNSVNLVPPFLFGFVMMFALMRLSKFSGGKLKSILTGSAFILTAALRYVMEFDFLEKHGYEALVIDPLAKKAYLTLIAVFAIETVLLTVLSFIYCGMLKRFVISHTGIEPQNERYSRQDKEFHRSLTIKVYISTALCILTWSAKLTDCVLRFFSKNTLVPIETPINNGGLSFSQSGVGVVNESLVPWFGAVLLIISILFIVHSFCFFSQLKEDVEMKYLDN